MKTNAIQCDSFIPKPMPSDVVDSDSAWPPMDEEELNELHALRSRPAYAVAKTQAFRWMVTGLFSDQEIVSFFGLTYF